MSKIVVVGDTHFDIKEPHFSAGKQFVEWFNKQDFNNENNIFVSLGDIYHHSNPNPKVHELGIHWFTNMKFNEKYVLAGNHDFNRSQNSYSIDALSKVKGIELIYNPQPLHNKDYDILFMPFMYDRTEYSFNKTQKEFYENYIAGNSDPHDFIFHHLQDSSIKFYEGDDSGIDLSNLKGELIGGHIHKRQKGYLGTPIITRFDEKNKDSYILLIDSETKNKEYIKVPNFLDYYRIPYDDYGLICTMKSHDDYEGRKRALYCIFDIYDAPSKEIALEKYKNFYIRNIELKKEINEELNNEVEENDKQNKTINDYFDSFCSKEKVSKKLRNKLQNYIINE